MNQKELIKELKKKNYSIEDLKKKKFSLVLSGGSSYGIAHIGVLNYLEEHHLKPEEIIGTSMGSIIAAFYSIGKTGKEIEKILKSFKYKKITGTSSRRITRRAEQFLKSSFGERKMSDALIPLKVIATELETGKGKVFDNKDNLYISEVLMASIAIPGIFNCMKIKGKTYLDGGIHSNLPLEYAKKNNIKIAINVINRHKKYYDKWKKKNIFLNILRRINELQYTIHYLIENQTYSKLKDIKKVILIEPQMQEFSKLNFSNPRKFIKKGYSAIKEYFLKD
jgi:NTE family protein